MIQIGHMNKVFHLKSGDVTALDNVTLNIEDGMIYGVIGYSGAGKSTLVRCLNLLETPDDGTLSVGDSGVITLRGGKAYDAQGRKLTEKKARRDAAGHRHDLPAFQPAGSFDRV